MRRYAGGKTPYELFSEAVDRKNHNSADTIALNEHKHKVKIAYRYYERAMDNQKLGLLTPSTVLSRIQQPLLGMYSSGCKLVKDFRTWHFNNNPQTYNNVCPYCTINSANTTEHILPKDVYPEYAVNVFNLIPACSECNSFKGEEIFDQNGKIFTINFYTDTLPDIRYLFARITSIEGGVQFEYYLENRNVVNANLYALIERHFQYFHLIDRYFFKAVQELSNIVNYFKFEEIACEADYDKAARKLIRKTDEDAKAYGKNHWKIVMYYDAATSPVFKSYIMTQFHLIT
ncbi:MAG: hypothetical protein J6Y78_10305 [Paludibacteraceae bacterium]|nr:hypothetical protein [Paludibacteraceae bacterium]